MPHRGIIVFAHALAARLPGGWQADDRPTPLAGDPAAARLWDSGPLAYIAVPETPHDRCVLTSPSGLQLYVTGHPTRRHQVIVAPLLPAGTQHTHTDGIESPRGITVPADPARAAAFIRRRQLYAVRVASMKTQTRASPGPLMPVKITLDPNGRPRVSTAHTRALYELLTTEGFRLNPATGHCHLPETVRHSDVSWRSRRAVQRLEQLGFSITIRLADGRTHTPHEPATPLRPRTPRPPAPAPRRPL
ncbi:hypothetical protein ACFWNG_05190 [Streptomyces sp. NPDC058391]|uniref:hypothetical protein n=1 Tax=Streptomyces sp. NPDC058391 TaxID=3346476 RepID=UPI0036591B17